jgi:hypothetical protein
MLRYRSQTSSYFLNSTITSIVFQVLCALTLPVGKWVVDYVLKNHEDNSKIFMAKYYCVRLHALFGMALASGLVLARNGTLV